jgi:hypothetical protein
MTGFLALAVVLTLTYLSQSLGLVERIPVPAEPLSPGACLLALAAAYAACILVWGGFVAGLGLRYKD